MHFNAQNAVPGLHEGRNGRLQKIFFFAAKKWQGYTPGVKKVSNKGLSNEGLLYLIVLFSIFSVGGYLVAGLSTRLYGIVNLVLPILCF